MNQLEIPGTVVNSEAAGANRLDNQALADELPHLLNTIFIGEKEAREKKQVFSKVVMGHSYADFDIDQLFAYYFALKGGLIPANAPVLFTTNVQAVDENNSSFFSDPTTLVIEGFGHKPEENSASVAQKKAQGNFANGINGEPAASELKARFGSTHFQRNLPDTLQLKDLDYWLQAQEGFDQTKRGSVRRLTNNVIDLDLIVPLFYGLKEKYKENTPQNQAQLLIEAVSALEKIVRGATTEEIRSTYTQELALGTQKEKDTQKTLVEKLSNPDTYRQVTTMSGITLTYFDIRGLNQEKGARALANSKGKSDVLLLIDDQKNPQNPEEIIGTQFKIFQQNNVPNNEFSSLLALLADRLALAEAQFGKGYHYSKQSSFGSHEAIVASPQSEGSDIPAEAMWQSLQHFFDYPRHTNSSFEKKATQIATALGTEQFTLLPVEPTHTSYELGTRKIIFTLPAPSTDDGALTTISLTEEDLLFYEPLLTGSVEENRTLLLQRTALSEPSTVIEKKAEHAKKWIAEYCHSNDAERLLAVLAIINEATLVSLPLEQKITILSVISQNNSAISHIWDKNDLTYGLVDLRLPEEIKPFMEEYKLNRYRLKSLARTIDTTLVRQVISESLATKDQGQQTQLAETLLQILTSEAYVQSHMQQTYDSLLPSLIFYATELKASNPTLATHLISELKQKYGNQMSQHWSQLDSSYKELLSKHFATEADPLFSLIPESEKRESISGLANSKLLKPNTVELSANIEAGKHNPTITLLVEITRPIAAKVLLSEFTTASGDTQTIDALDGYISTGAFNIEEGEHMKVVTALVPMVMECVTQVLLTNPDTKLRIIQGGFINRLSAQVQEHISQALEKYFMELRQPQSWQDVQNVQAEIRSFKQTRLFWSNHNRNTDGYVDSPFVEDKK